MSKKKNPEYCLFFSFHNNFIDTIFIYCQSSPYDSFFYDKNNKYRWAAKQSTCFSRITNIIMVNIIMSVSKNVYVVYFWHKTIQYYVHTLKPQKFFRHQWDTNGFQRKRSIKYKKKIFRRATFTLPYRKFYNSR